MVGDMMCSGSTRVTPRVDCDTTASIEAGLAKIDWVGDYHDASLRLEHSAGPSRPASLPGVLKRDGIAREQRRRPIYLEPCRCGSRQGAGESIGLLTVARANRIKYPVNGEWSKGRLGSARGPCTS